MSSDAVPRTRNVSLVRRRADGNLDLPDGEVAASVPGAASLSEQIRVRYAVVADCPSRPQRELGLVGGVLLLDLSGVPEQSTQSFPVFAPGRSLARRHLFRLRT